MTGTSQTAVIFGATGVVGGHCLDRLLGDPAYSRVITIGRRAADRQHDKLQEITCELDRLSGISASAVGSIDAAFCCLGSTQAKAGSREAFRQFDADYPIWAAHFAKRHGASRFLIVTALGADPRSRIFYNRVKGEAEVGVIASGVDSISIFRPSLLLGGRRELRWKEELGAPVLRALSVLMVGPARKFRPIAAETVARAMVAASNAPVRGTTIYESDRIAELGRR